MKTILLTDLSLSDMADADLVSSFREIVISERENLVRELNHIGELDRRQLSFQHASLWAFLVQECGMEEWAAERKIRAARLLRRFPRIREKLESGKLNLSLLEIAQGVASREKLGEEEFSEALESVCGLSCKKARRELADRYPQSADTYPDRIRPISAGLSEVRFVATEDLLEQLDEIRGLLAHTYPKLSLSKLIGVLATEYRERHHPEEQAKRAEERLRKKRELESEPRQEREEEEKNEKPREEVRSPASPRVPSKPLIHELTQKTGYQCAYVDRVSGQRCSSKFGLEIDHVLAWAQGGPTELTNLRYLCPSHHRRVSFLKFGDRAKFMAVRRI